VVIEGMNLQDALGTKGSDNPADDDFNDDVITGDEIVWYAKSVDKPKVTIAKLGEGFIPLGKLVSEMQPYPDIPEFSAVSMVLVDPSYPNATRKLIRWLRRTGYNDNTADQARKGVYGPVKGDAFLKTIGDVKIEQLDVDGSTLETWWLVDAFPQEIDFGKLDYSSNDLVEITINWAYTTIRVDFDAHGAEEAFEYYKDIPARLKGCEGLATRARKAGKSWALWQASLPEKSACKGKANY